MDKQTWKFSFSHPDDTEVAFKYDPTTNRQEISILYEESIWDFPACLDYGADGSTSLAEMISELHHEVLEALTVSRGARTNGYDDYSDKELEAFLYALRAMDSIKEPATVYRGRRANQILVDGVAYDALWS